MATSAEAPAGQADAGRSATAPPHEIGCQDVTARKAHQYTIAGGALLALVLGGPLGAGLLAAAGAVMLLGRFCAPADVVRQLIWHVAEPRGWLRPRLVPEEVGTRRIARVLGGLFLCGAAGALLAGSLPLALVITLPLCAMILFDATVSFCALCFVVFQARRLRYLLTR